MLIMIYLMQPYHSIRVSQNPERDKELREVTDLKVRYLYSMLSAIPYCLVAPTRVSEWARDAGYSGLQVAPHRGIGRRTQLKLPAFLIEGAWNPVKSLLQALLHQPGGLWHALKLEGLAGVPKPGEV